MTASVDVENITFRRFMVEHYLDWSQRNKASGTFEMERYVINARLIPFFGKTNLTDIDLRAVERYKAHRQKDGVTSRTINRETTLLSVAFKLAVQLGYARANPVKDAPKLRESRRPPRFLTQNEVERLLAAARETYLFPLVVTAVYTGMRKSELFNLRWEDVDFERNTVTIQPKPDWHPKNYEYRVLEMARPLREVLLAHRRIAENEYVFTYGGRRLTSNVQRTWNRIVRDANLSEVTLHTLRHTFASHLAMQGVPLMHIQQLMGHNDYDTTLVYAHLSTESHKGQVHKLPFDGGKKES
ncbi:MAG: tyrosine-type recombinase/integrase [Candidatus Poribacteria bacterium]|nr:tyrosine-type recombinase/integrase [Candidatus Poribacteria bacterium]